MYDIIIGRSKSDIKRLGTKGSILLGKQFIKMGRTQSLSNKIYMDISGAHVIFICGKRGGGKSYTMGVIAEGMADVEPEIKQNLSIIMLDTMGIYWTMKYPNEHEKDILSDWGLEPKSMDIVIYTPKEFYNKYKNEGIPTDKPFSVKPSDLSSDNWCMTFGIKTGDIIGILITDLITIMVDKFGDDYDIDDMIKVIYDNPDYDKVTKMAAINLFKSTKAWGVFDKEGTPLHDLAKGGQVTVLDVSCYATMPNGWNVKALIVGLVSEKLFIDRMVSRKMEEFQEVHRFQNYFSDTSEGKQDMPLVWLVIDEAHEFLPVTGSTTASDPLVTIMREGRQPGISLILATQQPGKIHTDVMTQSDVVLSHRITAKLDTEALGMLAQSYMRTGINQALDDLPRVKGAAVLFDDNNEKLYPMRVRPRVTWHGGSSPNAIKEKKSNNLF